MVGVSIPYDPVKEIIPLPNNITFSIIWDIREKYAHPRFGYKKTAEAAF
mgnify:CR=1 FL=1